MPENVNEKTVYTLFEVTNSIKKTIADRYKSAYWIKAEMNKLNYFHKSGHCFPDLVEKKNGKVVAEMRCIIWKDDFLKLNAKFQRVLKEPIKDGIKILFLATINFTPEHGLTLRIIDIDPSFTMGDLEKEKQESLKRLQDEGIFNQNKMLQLPLLTQRIAIISVNTSKGYQDFLGKIEGNSWGYKFFHMLFPSILQGDKLVEEMTTQLKRIKKVRTHFDAVAIIRGGGGDVGLSSFNNYEFAKAIALFPLPVLSGIGHITNDTIVEKVCHKSFITPTDLANFLFQEFHNFSVRVEKAREKIIDKSKRLILEEKNKFQSETKLFRSVTQNRLIKNRNEVKEHIQSLFQHSTFLFKNKKDLLFSTLDTLKKESKTFCNSAKQEIRHFAVIMKKDVEFQLNRHKFLVNQKPQQCLKSSKVLFNSWNENILQSQEKFSNKSLRLLKNANLALNNIEKNVQNMSPLNVMKRGYSITRINGKAVKSFDQVKVSDTLDTLLFDGQINSTVISSSKTTE